MNTKNTNLRKKIEEISATKIGRSFSDYLAQVRYTGKHLLIKKNGKPVAELRPLPPTEATLGDFLELWHILPKDAQWSEDLTRINRADKPWVSPWG